MCRYSKGEAQGIPLCHAKDTTHRPYIIEALYIAQLICTMMPQTQLLGTTSTMLYYSTKVCDVFIHPI